MLADAKSLQQRKSPNISKEPQHEGSSLIYLIKIS